MLMTFLSANTPRAPPGHHSFYMKSTWAPASLPMRCNVSTDPNCYCFTKSSAPINTNSVGKNHLLSVDPHLNLPIGYYINKIWI